MTTDFFPQLNSVLSSHACSGAASGFLIGALLQPLETIKVCIIVNPTNVAVLNNANFARSFLTSARIVYQDGGLFGFWKGLGPALWRIGVANSVYFHFLDLFNRIASRMPTNQRIKDFSSSCSARVISTLIINPLTIIKTRMELPGDHFNYRSTSDAAMQIYRKEGFRAFFKGAEACMFRDVPFAGLYYAVLNMCKENLSKLGVQSAASTMTSGMIAGLVATTATHPFDIVRTRLQINHNEESSKDTKEGTFRSLYNIWKTDGTGGLFRGLQARLMRKPLSNAMTFTFFEIFQTGKGEKRLL